MIPQNSEEAALIAHIVEAYDRFLDGNPKIGRKALARYANDSVT